MKKYVFAFIVTCFGGAVCSLSLDALSRTVPWVLGSHQLGLQVQEIDPPCTGGFLIDDYLFLRCKCFAHFGVAHEIVC